MPELHEPAPTITPPATPQPPEPTAEMPPSNPLPHPPSAPKSNRKLLLLIFTLIIFAALATAGFFIYQNYKLKQSAPTTTPTTPPVSETPTSTPDPTEGWKVYQDNTYSFKYPDDWKAVPGQESEEEYFNGDVVKVNSPSGKVVLGFFADTYPYGFGSDAIQNQETLNLTINNTQVSAIEKTRTDSNGQKAFIDLKYPRNGKNYHIIFGTGYPISDDQNTSYEEYLDLKVTIFQILSTFEFIETDQTTNWKEFANPRLKLKFKYPENYYFETIARDDGSGFSYLLGPNQEEVFHIMVRDDYSSPQAEFFLDTSSTGTLDIGEISWKAYYLPQGYGDGKFTIGADQAVYGLQLEKNGILYTLTFYKQSNLTSIQQQILSTFKFL